MSQPSDRPSDRFLILRQSNDHGASRLFDQISVPALLLNAQGDILAGNVRACVVLGCSDEELVGKRVCRVFPGNIGSHTINSPSEPRPHTASTSCALCQAVSRVFSGAGDLYRERFVFPSLPSSLPSSVPPPSAVTACGAQTYAPSGPGGSAVVVSLSFCDAWLEPVVLLVVHDLCDMDDECKTQQIPAQEQQLFHLAMDAINDGIWDWDIRTGACYFSPALFALLGYSEEEFPATYEELVTLLHPDDRAPTLALLDDALQHIRPEYEAEFRCRTKSGDWKWILARGRVVAHDPTGQATRMVGTHIDRTEKKQLELQRRQVELQLSRAKRLEALGTLAGGIAHDFNNILGAILGFAELGIMQHSRGIDAGNFLQSIRQSGLRARDLVAQLLAFIRHSVKLRVPVSLATLVSEELEILRKSLPSTVHINFSAPQHATEILGDRAQLQQVFANLCANAIHAMSSPLDSTMKSGYFAASDADKQPSAPHTLTIHLRSLTLSSSGAKEVGLQNSGPYLELSVTDTGHGMDAETQERVFDPYFSTRRCGTGSGLGLAVTAAIVRSHFGCISLSSCPGQGTTFRLLFPEATVLAPTSGRSDSANSVHQSGTHQEEKS